MPDSVFLERGISALKSDAVVHLGNFFGALKGSLNGQDIYARNNFLFIADRHYLVDFDADVDLIGQNYALVREFLALGFNPQRTVIYRQSDIRELFTIMWLLNCHTPAKELLDRKDYTGAIDPSLARVLYPQLMAADVLGLRASQVYVGPDEADHVSYCQEIAGFINSAAKKLALPVPRWSCVTSNVISGPGGLTMSRTNKNIIPIFGDDRAIRRCFQQIPVAKVRRREAINPDTDICFQLFQLMSTAEDAADVSAKYREAEVDQDDARKLVETQFFKYFDKARERKKENSMSDSDIEEILQAGQQRVRREMRDTLAILEDMLYYNVGTRSSRSF
ncbi:hypothetical protein [Bradyrhizobium acaciae]|uniref:hypothetical protein n=1 Tax=Bradyrhizobium acaciae TaxID=2683706 RepID=UPI001E61AFE8|nr:hypothetical protein [Bradyrhizobium acaciae]MCC8977595.1 hypothetical protein [Bradyrhizobium acaciae]